MVDDNNNSNNNDSNNNNNDNSVAGVDESNVVILQQQQQQQQQHQPPLESTGLFKLPVEVIEKLEAGAFRSLCEHLRERSDIVQNIELMTLSGFCRNCLAKWMVVEARRLVDSGEYNHIGTIVDESKDTSTTVNNNTITTNNTMTSNTVKDRLDQFGYNEAAKYIYGIEYNVWKKMHQKQSTVEQMEKYSASIHLHSKFDTQILETRSISKPQSSSSLSLSSSQIQLPQLSTTTISTSNDATTADTSVPTTSTENSSTICNDPSSSKVLVLASNVCCVDVDNDDNNDPYSTTTSTNVVDSSSGEPKQHQQQTQQSSVANLSTSTSTTKLALPFLKSSSSSSSYPVSIKIAIITVSDRAHNNQYTTGDLSGPAIQSAIESFLATTTITTTTTSSTTTDPTSSSSLVQLWSSLVNVQFIVPSSTSSYITTSTSCRTSTTSSSGSEEGESIKDIRNIIVPDDIQQIQDAIIKVTNGDEVTVATATAKNDNAGDGNGGADLVLTTGGTGFSPRDVTPEATRSLGDRMGNNNDNNNNNNNNNNGRNCFLECPGLMNYVLSNSNSSNSSRWSPINSSSSILSRGTAGIYNSKALVVNLPGNPQAAQDIIPILFPLAVQIITTLREEEYEN